MKFLKYFFILLILKSSAVHQLYRSNLSNSTQVASLAICKASLNLSEKDKMLKELDSANEAMLETDAFCAEYDIYNSISSSYTHQHDHDFIFFSFVFDNPINNISLLFDSASLIESVNNPAYKPCLAFDDILIHGVIKVMLIVEQEIIFEQFFASEFLRGRAFAIQGS